MGTASSACAGFSKGPKEPHQIEARFDTDIKQRNDQRGAFAIADANGDGKLDLEEFVLLVNLVHNNYYSREEIEEMFEEADDDNNGYVTLDEFKSLQLLTTATSVKNEKSREDRLKESEFEVDLTLAKKFNKYTLIEDHHGTGHEFTVIAFSWYTGKSEDILTFYEPFFSSLTNTRIVAVSGPFRKISIRPGRPGHCWFDYRTDAADENYEDEISDRQLKVSRMNMLDLLKEEVNRVGDSERVFLMGCSQGGYMMLDVCVNSPYNLGGVFGTRTALGSFSEITTHCTRTPIYQCHGDKDEIFGLQLCKEGQERLEDHDFKVGLKVGKDKTHYTDQTWEIEAMKKVFGEWMGDTKYKTHE